MRLSPFAEDAQMAILFNERPHPLRRAVETAQIVEKNIQKVKKLSSYWKERKQEHAAFQEHTYQQDIWLDTYLAYYFPVNVAKLQILFTELVAAGRMPRDISVIDIGVGTGTSAVAVLDFLLAWSNVCELYGIDLPVDSFTFTGYDAQRSCLQYAKQVVNQYVEVLEEVSEKYATHRQSEKKPGEIIYVSPILDRIIQWGKQFQWLEHDVQAKPLPTPESPAIVVASYVLNELDARGRENLQKSLQALPSSSVALLLEPGAERQTRDLNAWRCEFLQRSDKWWTFAPCAQELRNSGVERCRRCWNRRSAHFYEPVLFRRFRETVEDKRLEKDEYDNNLLSWSYVGLTNSPYESPEREPEIVGINSAENNKVSGCLRFMSRYSRDSSETIVACPTIRVDGQLRAFEVVKVLREPGFEIPPLQHGQVFEFRNASYTIQNRELALKLDAHAEVVVSEPEPASFLPEYSPRTRTAIDHIAYRLFGFIAMRDFQHDVLAQVLTGKSIFAIAATGGGKSECFILPAMLLPGVTIVVAPLKSLMQDQYEQRLCERYGFDKLATFINGDVPFKEREARLKRMEKGYYKLVYFTPEQLERSYVLSSIKRAHERVQVRYLALDEAHCISQWGHDFRPSYLNIVRRLKKAGIEPLPVRIALTATASPKVREDVCEELELDKRPVEQGGNLYVHSSNRPELNLIVRTVKNTDEKVEDILERLERMREQNKNNTYPGAAIVFMPHAGKDPDTVDYSQFTGNRGRRSATVTEFASYLEKALGEKVAIYHSKMGEDSSSDERELGEPNTGTCNDNHRELGDLRNRTRQGEQTAFIKGERQVMVATKGFGMGIDKPNIRLIIHRTPPANLEAYIQEAGRAGRDGEIADVVLYYSPDKPVDEAEANTQRANSDREIQEFFIKEKYIRRRDVDLMCRFLLTLQRRVGKNLYFTNDEVIDFFESQGDYKWPEFPPVLYQNVPEGHLQILRRGNEYKHKTQYISRILQAMYRFRPTRHTALIEFVQQVEIQLRDPRVINAQAIVNSNAYFGEILRERGISADQLEQLIYEAQSECGISRLAEVLQLSLTETAFMLRDIKAFGAHAGSERSSLLEFTMVTPKYSTAAGKSSLREWREYAGAYKRAAWGTAIERWRNRVGQQLSAPYHSQYAEVGSFVYEHVPDFARRVGALIRRYEQSSNGASIEEELTIAQYECKIRIAEQIPQGAKVIYCRNRLAQRLNNSSARTRYRDLCSQKSYEEAQKVLVSQCGFSSFEASLFTNPKVYLVAWRAPHGSDEKRIISVVPAVPGVDDWFSWEECNRSVGWEVQLGEVFQQGEERLQEYIDAFMREHDQRQQDDWNSYNYMLNDYVGINSEGKGNCLRAVMLGYLKTNEVVVGDNCRSCSRCVPDEKFEHDMEQRKNAVQRLSQEIQDILSQIERDYSATLASQQMFDRLWELVRQEAARGRSADKYLKGWTGRILTDSPEHQSVHWLRIDAMTRGIWEAAPSELVEHIARLVRDLSLHDLPRLRDAISYACEILPESPHLLWLKGEWHRRQGQHAEEVKALEEAASLQDSPEKRRYAYQIYSRLAELYSSEGLLPNPEKLKEYSLLAARVAEDAQQAIRHYAELAHDWNVEQLYEELLWLKEASPSAESKISKLVSHCLSRNSFEPTSIVRLADLWCQLYPQSMQVRSLQEASNLLLDRLQRVLHEGADDETRERACLALALLGKEQAVPALQRALQDTSVAVRLAACTGLAHIRSNTAVVALGKALKDSEEAVRYAACSHLRDIGGAGTLKLLKERLNDPSARIRALACEHLKEYIHEEEILRALTEVLNDEEAPVAQLAHEALRTRLEAALPFITEVFKREDKHGFAGQLFVLGGNASLFYLGRLMKEGETALQRRVEETLSHMDTPLAKQMLTSRDRIDIRVGVVDHINLEREVVYIAFSPDSGIPVPFSVMPSLKELPPGEAISCVISSQGERPKLLGYCREPDDNRPEFLREFEGSFVSHVNGHGRIQTTSGDIHVPSSLAKGLPNMSRVRVLAVRCRNPRSGNLGWKALRIL